MKILVSIKRVVDYNVRIQVKPDGSGVMTEGVKMSVNPFDEIALEEAIRLRERGQAVEIVAVGIGGQEVQEQLRSALAMGADRAILVKAEKEIQPLLAARILKAIIQRENPRLVLMGKQAIDDDCNQTPQMLAGLLDWPQATFASKIDITGDAVRVIREVDAGLERLTVDLPAVISADLRLNEPRYVKLPDIMKARRKAIEIVDLEELNVEPAPVLKTLKTNPPPKRMAGKKVATVEELVAELREKGFL